MDEAAASIPDNSEEAPKNEEKHPDNPQQLTTPPVGEEVTPQRKPGRPPGSKDKAPRRRVLVEPLAPQPTAPEHDTKLAARASPVTAPEARDFVAPREPSPPPSPKTLYRRTSEQLLSLREHLNHQKRQATVDRYTRGLHDWGG